MFQIQITDLRTEPEHGQAVLMVAYQHNDEADPATITDLPGTAHQVKFPLATIKAILDAQPTDETKVAALAAAVEAERNASGRYTDAELQAIYDGLQDAGVRGEIAGLIEFPHTIPLAAQEE